ncbi:MAG: hypothetical protein WCK85_07460 [Chlorobium sp.]
MKKYILLLIIFVLLSALSWPLRLTLWKEPTNSNKYDLDYILKDLPKSEVEKYGDDIKIQGLSFPKESYRILYEDALNKTITIQIKNPDTADADYVFPLRKSDIDYIKRDKAGNLITMKYKGRVYDPSNTNLITETKEYFLLQMLQPPPGFRLKYDFRLSFSEIIAVFQILTIIIAALVYFRESNREKIIVKREIYQRLELSAIDLFKFEGTNAEKLWCLYSDFTEKKFPEKDTHEYWALQEYVCQIIGLFEMIVEFKKQNIIDTQVFLSWGQWFWDISTAAHFQDFWDEIKMNYTVPLRNAMDTGIACSIEEMSYEMFLQKIGKQFNCEIDVKVFLKKELGLRDYFIKSIS